MKEPLKNWRGTPAEFEPNSVYDSLGTVTITIPVEVAMFLVGVQGPLRCDYELEDGRVLNMYDAFYVPLVDDVQGVVPQAVREKLSSVRNMGRDIGKGGISAASRYSPKV